GLFGLGMWNGLSNTLIMNSAPPEKAGSASSISETGTEFGIAFGVAALGSIATAVYRDQAATTLPSGLPPETVDVATDSISGATAVAGDLPGPVAESILAAAGEAFTEALHIVTGICAGLFVLLAVVALAGLRKVPAGKDAVPPEMAGEAAPDDDAVTR
ncbi:MFS transporter, partial [Actinomycetes bacterium KLBMP 9759]